jgi:hypothetical protein
MRVHYIIPCVPGTQGVLNIFFFQPPFQKFPSQEEGGWRVPVHGHQGLQAHAQWDQRPSRLASYEYISKNCSHYKLFSYLRAHCLQCRYQELGAVTSLNRCHVYFSFTGPRYVMISVNLQSPCYPAVLDSNPAIYSTQPSADFQSLNWLPSTVGWYFTVGCPWGASEENRYKRAYNPPKTKNKTTKDYASFLIFAPLNQRHPLAFGTLQIMDRD